jgi:hypothetical protein
LTASNLIGELISQSKFSLNGIKIASKQGGNQPAQTLAQGPINRAG